MDDHDSVDKLIANTFFKHVRAQSNNKRCADCDKPSPIWIAVTYGFFICTECAAKHRELGVEISKVKSMILDGWKLSELRRVYVSGNANASKLGKGPDMRLKYTGAEWYAKNVDDMVKKSEIDEPGMEFIHNLECKSKNTLQPKKVSDIKMPKFSEDAIIAQVQNDDVIKDNVSNKEISTAPVHEEAVIKKNSPASLRISSRNKFNLENNPTDTNRLGFGALNLKDSHEAESSVESIEKPTISGNQQ
ncbi:GTPase-activating protein [Ordospora colligata]|uniref:GTPase-activating protein n=1 Tax=Ordospora colligata OC4 TaxID=1354746 RepID=A0A0B2UIV0_9MICR|nr:GTPase-activating protein [Ordospora colligata OC4]KHN69238.1 GTPase-activating protein [Ordospora colligata OC4]TBU14516.1 GTPase-activating protein [Ordospora colligata]TBU14693.1 GTPase-activating protein [Ordospora colligata]TBU18078.1 GTPase-activating protein [Ordospora colligata]